jgi:hypothetical protein
MFEFKGYRTCVAFDAELNRFVYRQQPPPLETDRVRAEVRGGKSIRGAKGG